jgi:dGTPase
VGHTPFGHAGQDALHECMRDLGGFEHNLQSLRIVDELEEQYAEFSGLNLSFECREGILKHCSAANARLLGDVGERFLNREQPSLEAQLANFADEIAYNNHDIDDGIRAGLISVEQLISVPLFARFHAEVIGLYPALGVRRLVYEVVRRMINLLVTDLIGSSRARIEAAGVNSIDQVRGHATPLIGFSEETHLLNRQLKLFLREHVYKHYKVQRMTSKARRTLVALFNAFFDDPGLLPDEHRAAATRGESLTGPSGRARAVADYIAGMTDRYAILEHRRLFDPAERT